VSPRRLVKPSVNRSRKNASGSSPFSIATPAIDYYGTPGREYLNFVFVERASVASPRVRGRVPTDPKLRSI